jgi:hypothetical protein
VNRNPKKLIKTSRQAQVMRIPTLFGVIKRRFLINYRAHPKAIKGILLAPFEAKLHRGYAIVSSCFYQEISELF